MDQNRTSRHHPEIGSVALRMLWIPVIAATLVGGYLTLTPLRDDNASTMAVATAKELAVPQRAAFTNDAAPRLGTAVPASPDDSIAKHEALDPVGAGHELSR
jgi:hypothetical protein